MPTKKELEGALSVSVDNSVYTCSSCPLFYIKNGCIKQRKRRGGSGDAKCKIAVLNYYIEQAKRKDEQDG